MKCIFKFIICISGQVLSKSVSSKQTKSFNIEETESNKENEHVSSNDMNIKIVVPKTNHLNSNRIVKDTSQKIIISQPENKSNSEITENKEQIIKRISFASLTPEKTLPVHNDIENRISRLEAQNDKIEEYLKDIKELLNVKNEYQSSVFKEGTFLML